MNRVGYISILGMIFGMLGTTLGGIFGAITNIKSQKIINFVLSLSAILMLFIIYFDLVPESLKFVNYGGTLLGIGFGIILMIFCNNIVNKKISSVGENKLNLLKVGIVIGIGLCIHNFPEGLAIGSGFGASTKLGIGAI